MATFVITLKRENLKRSCIHLHVQLKTSTNINVCTSLLSNVQVIHETYIKFMETWHLWKNTCQSKYEIRLFEHISDLFWVALSWLVSLLAMWTLTRPDRMPLKMAMASEWDKPDVEWPLTERISSPETNKIYYDNCIKKPMKQRLDHYHHLCGLHLPLAT